MNIVRIALVAVTALGIVALTTITVSQMHPFIRPSGVPATAQNGGTILLPVHWQWCDQIELKKSCIVYSRSGRSVVEQGLYIPLSASEITATRGFSDGQTMSELLRLVGQSIHHGDRSLIRSPAVIYHPSGSQRTIEIDYTDVECLSDFLTNALPTAETLEPADEENTRINIIAGLREFEASDRPELSSRLLARDMSGAYLAISPLIDHLERARPSMRSSTPCRTQIYIDPALVNF